MEQSGLNSVINEFPHQIQMPMRHVLEWGQVEWVLRKEFSEWKLNLTKIQTHTDQKVRRLDETLERLATTQERTDQKFQSLAEAQEHTDQKVSRLDEALERLATAQERTEQKFQSLADAQEHTEQKISRLDEALESLATSQESLAEAQKRTEKQFQSLAEALERTDQKVSRLDEALERLAAAQERTEQRVQNLEEALERTDQRVQGLEEALERTDQRVRGLAEALDRTDQRMTDGFKTLTDQIAALGGRWGIYNEGTFRSTIRGLMRDVEGTVVEEGFYGGRQVDVIIRNGEHVMLEITSRMHSKDIAKLYGSADDYRDRTGVEPKLMVATSYVAPSLMRKLMKLERPIEIFSYDPEE